MGKAAIIQVLCAEAPGRQACRWRAPAEGNIEGFPDELDISWGAVGGGRRMNFTRFQLVRNLA